MISADVFNTHPSVPYDKARGEIRSGDLLLCSGSGLVSDIIKDATKSLFSHVAIILELAGVLPLYNVEYIA